MSFLWPSSSFIPYSVYDKTDDACYLWNVYTCETQQPNRQFVVVDDDVVVGRMCVCVCMEAIEFVQRHVMCRFNDNCSSFMLGFMPTQVETWANVYTFAENERKTTTKKHLLHRLFYVNITNYNGNFIRFDAIEEKRKSGRGKTVCSIVKSTSVLSRKQNKRIKILLKKKRMNDREARNE